MIFSLLFMIGTISSFCNENCTEVLLNNSNCDFSCMTASCDFDLGDCLVSCNQTGCNKTSPDSSCDLSCNFKECGYDYGDCLDCSPGCTSEMLENTSCQSSCNNSACNYQNGICFCAPDCPPVFLKNSSCQHPCNNSACNYQNGICLCSPECTPEKLGNSSCQPECNNSACNYQNGICLCSPQCTPEKLANSSCQPECNNLACNYQNELCLCSSGCTPEKLENSSCQIECNNSACNFQNEFCNCSFDCTPEKLKNLTCQVECNNSACNYQNELCLCSSGCTPTKFENSSCQKECNNSACNYQDELCLCSSGCTPEKLANSTCQTECNNSACNFQNELCLCSAGCTPTKFANSSCQAECNNSACNYQNEKCLCASGCTPEKIANSICDSSCNNSACNYDNDTCLCAPGCTPEKFENSTCEDSCNNLACNYQNEICLCAPGCTPEKIENSTCQLSCNNSECDYQNGKCLCSPGCYPDLISNKICDKFCNESSCWWDGNDCDCNSGCHRNMINDSICNPECNVSECFYDWDDCNCAHGCNAIRLGNNICDLSCNVSECFYDYEDCNCDPECDWNWINNGVCQTVCNTNNCSYDGGDCNCHGECYEYMIRNSYCDSDCNVTECIFDDGDCDCFPGCSPTMFNTGTCDDICNRTECHFDGNDCNCNTDCHQSMLNNNICDVACNVSSCFYDYEDCECDTGCNPAMLNNSICDPSCNTSLCNFDYGDCDCSPGCTLELLQNNECDPVCDVKVCWFDWGLCGSCASGCFESMIFNSICDDKCQVADCDYDSLGCTDTFFYWANFSLFARDDVENVYEISNNEYFTFTNESLNVQIYVLGGDFWFINQTDLFEYLTPEIVIIEPLYCSLITVDGCYMEGQMPVFYVMNGKFFGVNMILTFKNIQFSAFHNISFYSSAEYCQYLNISGYQVYNDRKFRIDGIFSFLNDSICSKSVNFNYFDVKEGGFLGLYDVAFKNIRYNYKSIIFLNNGSAVLEKVDFFNIVTHKSSAVIVTPSSNCLTIGSSNFFTYNGGSVTFINNGYEIIPENPLAGFLSLCNINETVIKNIYFSLNIFSGPDSHLLNISKFYKLELSNLTISYNMCNSTLIKINQSEISSMVQTLPNYLNIQHVDITGLNITHTLARTLLSLIYKNDCQNIKISASSFENNEAINSLVNYSINTNDPLCIDGPKTLSLSIPTIEKRKFEIINTNFYKNKGKFLINLEKTVNLALSGLTFRENFKSEESLNVLILKEIKKYRGYMSSSYLNNTEVSSCLISTRESQGVSIYSTNFIENLLCLVDIFSLYKKIELVDSNFRENESQNGNHLVYIQKGNGLSVNFEKTDNYIFKNLVFEKNRLASESNGIITINEVGNNFLNFTKLTFIDNDQAFHINFVRYLNFRDVRVANSSSSLYSFLFYFPLINSDLQIENCKFEGNPATILSINASISTVLNLQIKESTFSKNSAKTEIFIENKIKLSSTSALTSSRIESNSGLFMYLVCEGSFILKLNRFSLNLSKTTVILLSEGDMRLSLTSNNFMKNEGPALVEVSSDKNATILESFNNSFTLNKASSVYISNILYRDNSSKYLNNSFNTGTVLYSTSFSVAIIQNSLFSNNSASSNGNIANVLNSALYLFELTIENNESSEKGGFLFNDQDSSFFISSSTFTKNTAKYGSCIYSHYSSELNLIENSTFSQNKIGSSISLLMSSLDLKFSSFLHNKGKIYSGIDLSYLSEVTITDCTFNNSQGSGGLVLIGTSSKAVVVRTNFFSSFTNNVFSFLNIVESSFVCKECKFFNGTAQGAGSVFCDKSVCSFFNCEFEKFNNGKSEAVLVAEDASLSLQNVFIRKVVGSGVFLSSKARFYMNKSWIENCIAFYGSGLRCIDCSSVTINNSRITSCESENYGGALIGQGTFFIIPFHLQNSQIDSNSAQSGGGLYASSLNLSISNTSFKSNSAHSGERPNSGKGGGLFIESSLIQSEIFINSSIFSNNSANISGGGIQSFSLQPIIIKSNFSNNSAFYGKDIASFGSNLALDPQTSNSLKIAPGSTISKAIIINVIDHYGQTVLTDNSASVIATVHDKANIFLMGTMKKRADQGSLNFSDLGFKGKANSSTILEFFSDIRNSSNVFIEVNLRECFIGETFKSESCIVCGEGFYNLKPAEPCKKCPKGAICYGGANIIADKGYWRTDNLSDVFYECLYKKACLKEKLGEDRCLKGYTGTLCQACQDGYSRTEDDKCSKCVDRNKNIIVLTFVIVGGLIVIFGLSYANINGALKEQSVTSVYYKILTNYLQIISITISFDLNWPKIVLKMFEIQGQPVGATSRVYSIDCYISGIFHRYYAKLILINLIPIFTSTITILFFLFLSLCRKTTYLKSKMIGSIIVQIFFFQPSIIQMNFSMFNCLKISNGEFYMTKEMSIKCWSEEHLFYTLAVAVPGIGAWCVLVPIILLISLRRAHQNLDKIWEKLKYGFLYKGYKDHKFFWEFLIFFRKLGIISCAVFLSNYSIYMQALSTFIFIAFGFIIQLKFQPYNLKQLNKMEIRSIVVSAVTIYGGLFFMTDDLNEFWKIIVFVVMVLSNLAFLYYWGYYTLGYYVGTLCIKLNCWKKKGGWVSKVVPEINLGNEKVDEVTSNETKISGIPQMTSPTTKLDSIGFQFNGSLEEKKVKNSGKKKLKLQWVRAFK